MKLIPISFAIALVMSSFCASAQTHTGNEYMSEEVINKTLPWKFPVIPFNGGRHDWTIGPERNSLYDNLKTFFGTATGNYVNMQGLVNDNSVEARTKLFDQFSWANVRSDAAYLLPNGNRLLVGFQHDDVNTRSIIVTSGNTTQILATALIHRFCGRDNFRDLVKNPKERLPSCDKNPTMTIFYAGRIAPNTEINEQLNEFAMRYVQRFNYRGAGGRKIEKLLTEVRVLNGK